MTVSWKTRALCASGQEGVDPNDFQVPLRGTSQNKAKNVCAECPVQLPCLREALENAEIWGVWGGLDEAEVRRALSVDATGRYRKRCRAPSCPNPHCRARPSSLEVSGDRKRPLIQCLVCAFEWRSATSALALRTYHRERLQLERQRQRLRARVVRTPIEVLMAANEARLRGRVVPLPMPVARQEGMALVASAGPLR